MNIKDFNPEHFETLLVSSSAMRGMRKLEGIKAYKARKELIRHENQRWQERKTNFNKRIREKRKESGPIGLSLVVCISQIWMIHTMEKAISIAQERGVNSPHHITIYMDDCWGVVRHQPPPRRPGLRSSTRTPDPAEAFNECLNSVHTQVKFTKEEEIDASVAFLDVHLTHLRNSRISTCIYRKPPITNLIIQPQSCQDPNTVLSSFKSEICREHNICTSPLPTQNEINFTSDVF
jgi:hypothetical protein